MPRRSLLRKKFAAAGAAIVDADEPRTSDGRRPSFFRQLSAGQTPRFNFRYKNPPPSPASTRSSATSLRRMMGRSWSFASKSQASPSTATSTCSSAPEASQWSSTRPVAHRFTAPTSRRGANKWVRKLPALATWPAAKPAARAEPGGFVERIRGRTTRAAVARERSSSLRSLFKSVK